MWGAGGGAAGQAQNWGFNAQQVATEQEKWAALAHQWIQMKSCGAGLEQTLQPPLPPPQAGVNNNGTSNNHSHHSHSHNDSMDQIGEAPMDLDDSVSAFQQNHLIQQPLPLLNVNHQSLYTPDLITQIPPNPVISFSSMAPASSLQLPTRPLEPHPMQHQQLFQPAKIPSLMEQPFHHIQPPLSATQQLGQRLLHPSYLDHARQPTPPHHSASPSQGKSNNRRKSKQHPQSEYSDPQTVTSFEADQQNNYGYSSETTNSEVFEGIPRRSLPPWIREGLEKVEQEKRRMEQKEREDELRKKKEAERREQRQGLGDSEGPESDEDNSRDGGYTQLQKGYEMPKPYIPETQQQTPLLSAMSKRGTNETQPVLGLELLEPNQKVLTFRRPKSPTMEELMEGMSEDDRVELAMTVVRRQLTMILLEVTTDEMRQVAKDCIARAKQKGLGGYETDSGSEDDEHAASQDNKRKPDSGEESSDNDEDSEAELVEEIEKKRLNFELRENEFTTNRHDSVNPRSTKLKPPTPETPKQKELTELSKKSLMEPPPTEAASVPKSPLQAPTTTPRKSESPINDHSHGGGSIRRTSSASEHEPSGHKREHPKSPDRDRVREHGRRHRSRSRERKKDDHRRRKSQSRSNSKERRPRSKSKSRSRERDRNRKRKSKSTSRSKSRDRDHDRKNRKRTRSRSHSPSKDRDRKKKHSRRSKSRSRSDSSSSRRRHRERRRRSSSSSSSSRGNRRKHKRHDKEKDERKEKSSSKKKSLRSRSRSPSKSKTGTSSSHSHRSKKNRHSRSKSPAVSTSSRPT